MMLSPVKFILAGLAYGAALASLSATANEYPTESVTMVIPFTAGGSNDGIGRYLAQGLSDIWKETVVVENRPGAGAAIGASYVSRSKPDGHTLMFVSGTITVTAATRKNLPFDPFKDLQPVAMGARGDMVFVSGSRIPVNSLQELIQKARSQTIFYGTTGVGSITHLTSELLSQAAGIKMEPVHYRGGTDALVDLAGGRLDLYAGSTTQVMSTLANNMATALAVSSSERAPSLPDTPTLAEEGVEGANVDLWWGVFAPAGTPEHIVSKINDDIRTILGTEAAATFLASQGAAPAVMGVEEFSNYYYSEIAMWQKLVNDLEITTE